MIISRKIIFQPNALSTEPWTFAKYLALWIRRLVRKYFRVKSSGGCRFNPNNK